MYSLLFCLLNNPMIYFIEYVPVLFSKSNSKAEFFKYIILCHYIDLKEIKSKKCSDFFQKERKEKVR